MPMSYSTWGKAEARYKEKGMSESEIAGYKKAWFKKHKKSESGAKGIVGSQRKLEELEKSLEGSKF